MADFTLRQGEEYIKLGQLLKAMRLVDEGSDAKFVIADGKVSVNGEACTMRGKKIHDGDTVSYNGEVIHVHQHA
ncbi:MAG TPA: RNA-binding protein [Lachnospiraceae bacterium]|jgi:ribosome-associated protein|nr:RNA-binding protein [Lachnospiraceae bacterium]